LFQNRVVLGFIQRMSYQVDQINFNQFEALRLWITKNIHQHRSSSHSIVSSSKIPHPSMLSHLDLLWIFGFLHSVGL